MGVFSTVFNNPYMKWGVAPGAVGAAGGAAYGSYLNYADGTKHNLGTSATLGALGGLALTSPAGLTSRARRDYAMVAATRRATGYGDTSVSAYSRALREL